MTYFPIPKDFNTEVLLGNVPGFQFFTLVGVDSEVQQTFNDIWQASGNIQNLPLATDAAESWEVLSDNVNDTAAGTGARTAIISGLDDEWNEQTQLVSLNGTTPVAIPGTWRRPRACLVRTSGSSPNNEGSLTVRVAGGGDTRIPVAPDQGVSLSAIYTVPAGKTAYFKSVQTFVPKDEDVVLRSRFTNNAITDGATTIGAEISAYQTPLDYQLLAPLTLTELTDLKVQALSTNIDIQVTFFVQLLIVDNEI